jgi:hypothetical protein
MTANVTPEMAKSLASAQAEIENAVKNAANPHFRSKYADLAEVLGTARPVYAKHGLALIQGGTFDGTYVTVTSLLTHSSGGHVTHDMSCVPAKADAQGVGAAMTYLRRYSAAAIYGIAQEDDDGNTASGRPAPAAPALPSPPPSKGWKPTPEAERAIAGLLTVEQFDQFYEAKLVAKLDKLAPPDRAKAMNWLEVQAAKIGGRWDSDKMGWVTSMDATDEIPSFLQ